MSEIYFTFNGKSSKDFAIEVRQVGRDILPQFVSNDTENVPGRPGNYSWGTNVGQYKIPVWIQWNRRGNFEDFRQLTRQIAAWLDTEGKPAPLVFSDEPDKTYYAYLTGGTSVDQLLHMGQATLTFNCPYPYAYGKQVTRDGLEAVYTSFRRNSSAYDPDYNEVAEGIPRYEAGKYGQGIFIEEGTTNLLLSASSPTQEEVPVSVGDDYYLTTVGGSATVEHKKHEALNLRLDKEGEGGQDFQHTDTTRNDFMAGTHQNTTIPNGSVTLARSGTDYDFTWDTKEEWEDPSNIRNNTGSADEYDDLDIIDLPQWNFIDHFEDYTDYWSQVGSGGQLLQRDTYVTIRGNVSRSFGIDIQNDPNIRVRFPATVALKYRNRGPQSARFIIEQGNGEGYIVELDDVSGNWVYLWMTIQNGTATIYKNGQLVGNVASTGASTINQMQLYIPGGRNADFDVDYLYVDWDYNKGAPPSNGWWEGTWETPWIDLSQVGIVEETLLEWEYWYTDANIEDSDCFIEYQVRKDGVAQGWNALYPDPEIEGPDSWTNFMSEDLNKGDSTSGVEIKLRVTLRTRDPANWPYLEYLRLYLKSGYHKTGTYTSPVFDISTVGTAVDSLLTGVTTTPSGTSVSVEVSVDGGSFTTASFDSPIPGIADTTPSTLQYRIILETTDVSVRPSLEEITIQIIAQGTTYVPEKTFSLDAVDVSSIGVAAGSIIEWLANTPESTSIIIETSLDGSNWTQATNGGLLFPDGTDLTGKSVYIRGTLSTTDNTVTPTLSYVAWRITQQEPNRIKPATETLILTPEDVTRWQLEPKTYPTTWTVGTRESESLRAYRFSRMMNVQEGTFLIWAFDDLKDLGRRRYVFDTDDHLFSLFREGSTYHLQIDGQDFATAPAVSGWVQFGVRWSGQTFAFFVNGSKVAESGIGSVVDWETESDLLYVGCDYDEENQWNQTLDDIHVSERAMTDGEILDAYNSPTSLPMEGDTTYKMDFEGSFVDPSEGILDVGGTAETFPVFQVNFSGSTSVFRITHVGKGQSLIIRHDFNPGDELIVDAEKSKIIINGAVQMTALDLASDFFSLTPGRNELDFDPDGVAEISATWTERWK